MTLVNTGSAPPRLRRRIPHFIEGIDGGAIGMPAITINRHSSSIASSSDY